MRLGDEQDDGDHSGADDGEKDVEIGVKSERVHLVGSGEDIEAIEKLQNDCHRDHERVVDEMGKDVGPDVARENEQVAKNGSQEQTREEAEELEVEEREDGGGEPNTRVNA